MSRTMLILLVVFMLAHLLGQVVFGSAYEKRCMESLTLGRHCYMIEKR